MLSNIKIIIIVSLKKKNSTIKQWRILKNVLVGPKKIVQQINIKSILVFLVLEYGSLQCLGKGGGYPNS